MTPRRLFALAALPLIVAACETAAPASTTAATPARPPFVVFFTEDSAAVDDSGDKVIAQAAAAAKLAPAAPVAVLGFAGPAGSVAYNKALSDARARNVADHLVAAGVAQGRIQIRPRGPVAYDLVPTESRRVEIVVGG